MVAHKKAEVDAEAIVRNLHGFVTYGPWDLDIASALAVHGFDEVKWAEGQGMLAELVSSDSFTKRGLAAAAGWYEEAVTAARCALAAQPQLLTKLGVASGDLD